MSKALDHSSEMATIEPVFAALKDDTRYAALQAKNLININVQRAIAELPPLDGSYNPIQAEEETNLSDTAN